MSTVLAKESPPGEPSPDTVAAPSADDSVLEVGVEWVEDYSNLGWSNLPATRPDALGLYNQLGYAGWTKRFAWGNGNAWEQDWKKVSAGGTEPWNVDSVDLAYFAGHGNSNGFYFDSLVDDHGLTYNDCRLSWGNGDADWIGIAACNVLDNSHVGDWSYCMNGLRLLMGFKTTMADKPHGLYFGWYLRLGYNFTQAWFRATDRLQPQGVVARILAEEYFQFWDRPYRHNQPFSMDYSTYFMWTHAAGSEHARPVNIDLLQGTMPVFRTEALNLDDANAKWTQLGQAFGVTTTVRSASVSALQDDPTWMSNDNQLEMDISEGLYAYTELDSLWAEPPTSTKKAAPTRLLSLQEAKDIADQFLNNNGLMSGDAQYYETVAETSDEGVKPGESLSASRTLQSQTEVIQVIYSRILTYTVPGARAPQQIEFSVVGPGAKLKVYVAPQVTVGLSPQATLQQAIIGGVGGWRSLDQGARTKSVLEDVTMLDYDTQIVPLFNTLESNVALDYIPLDFDSRTVLTRTVAYYELPMGTGQDQLIPVYDLDVEYNLTNQEVVTAHVYIPVNEDYMAPFAQINTQIPTSTVELGQEVVFQASDASANLSTLGFDSALSFALGTGDSDSYIYDWFLNSTEAANKIGTGRTLTHTVSLSAEAKPEGLVPQTIILRVTDSYSPRPPSVSTDVYVINVKRVVFLPLLNR